MFELSNWVHSFAGAIHVLFSVIGLFSGAWIIATRKGTYIHKYVGYTFALALLTVNLSALFIYDFNQGKVSVFHYLIPLSLCFLIYGMYPVIFGDKKKHLNRHIIGMIGAVYGLYAAGATEYFVRELAQGLTKNELMVYSFIISAPFGILITASIIYFQRKYIKSKKE